MAEFLWSLNNDIVELFWRQDSDDSILLEFKQRRLNYFRGCTTIVELFWRLDNDGWILLLLLQKKNTVVHQHY